MFFTLSRFLFFVFSPFTWIVIFLMIALLSKNNMRKKKFLLLSFLSIIFFSNTFIFDRFINAWEVPAINEDKIGTYDAAIVLTGMTTFDAKNNRVEFNDRTDRIMQAMKLYRMQKVKNIILSGGPSSGDINDNSELVKLNDYLIESGISKTHIFTEMVSKNTHQNAIEIKQMLNQFFPHGKFLLITSGYHMRRSTACFMKEGIDVTPYSTDMFGGPVKIQFDYLFLPSAETLFNWEKLFHEWVGAVIYWILGYI
jgi:uncharacterized SAM-binding protein YcdF (DUF218 family)